MPFHGMIFLKLMINKKRKDNLSQMTRTALAYREIYYPYLVDQWRKVKNESWFEIHY